MNETSMIGPLQDIFAGRLATGVPLARYSAARIGGPAEILMEAHSADELHEIVEALYAIDAPFIVLGGGSNVLISDEGIRGVVVLNKAKEIRFESAPSPMVWAESGASFGLIARQAAQHGFAGLEWAAGIPGTLGGAVVGNAGAHGGDVAGNLVQAVILHRKKDMGSVRTVREEWSQEKLGFAYRTSILKQQPEAVVLSALLRLKHDNPELIKERMDEFVVSRRRTQPPGASMGSMFKNPPGDYAGRLIDECDLKGKRIGDAQISSLHANFFINLGQASAGDVFALISLAHDAVQERFNIDLELEIELLGEFPGRNFEKSGV